MGHDQEVIDTCIATSRFLRSEQGKKFMTLLSNEFPLRDVVGEDALATYFNLGGQDVINYIVEITAKGEKEDV